MNTNKKTLKQLARSLDVDLREVSKAAQQTLKLPHRNANTPEFMLNQYQCKQIQDVLMKSSPASKKALPKDDVVDGTQSERSSTLQLRVDPPSASAVLEYGDMNHGIWFHPEVSDAVHGLAHLRKRLGIILQHLGAHGRTTVVKGCRDEVNKGWLRSPLGGNNGMHYYLWWAPHGSRPTKAFPIPGKDILVRAVRHHDDHTPLVAGESDDYLHFKQREIEDNDLVARPWTKDQLEFVDSNDPVRVILGRPGSGKTTVLWKAVEARSNQRVLYLTYSRELTRYANEHFKAFAPKDVQVKALDFAIFISEVCQVDIKKQTLSASRSIFETVVSRLGENVLGPWNVRKEALHAEIRGILIGSAVPGEEDCVSSGSIVHLSEAAYLTRRGGREGIGRAAAKSLLKIFNSLNQDKQLTKIFPELAAAEQAIQRLRDDDVPAGFLGFDRMVVDEIQDLTLLEAAVVVELCRAIARRNGYAPLLLIAGDDGQTVRPSGFEWGRLNNLIARRVGTPSKFQLNSNLRCPSQIVDVLERTSTLYAHLEKVRRPTKQRNRSVEEHVNAYLYHVDATTNSNAVELLEQLEDTEGVVVLSPQNVIPRWIPEHLQDMVLTPEETKGLEYQSVCLLDPGILLDKMKKGPIDGKFAELEEHYWRTTIDQFRVALSRATETLVFIDVNTDVSVHKLSLELLGKAALSDPEDLVADHFTDMEVTAEERVLARTKDARTLIDERPRRAWRRAYQAMRLLGDPDLPNGVSVMTVRQEAQNTLLAIAARLLVDGIPKRVRRRDVIKTAQEVLKTLESESNGDAFNKLVEWSVKQSSPPFALLESILSLGNNGDWLRDALAPVSQKLRNLMEDGANSQITAGNFTGDVEKWLELTGYAGDTGSESRRLRCKAFDTLLLTGELTVANQILPQIVPEDFYRKGQLREAQERHEDAAEAFERTKANIDALRNWRKTGKWERAVNLAKGTEKDDLEWLISIEKLAVDRPNNLEERLTAEEHSRLGNLLETFKMRPNQNR